MGIFNEAVTKAVYSSVSGGVSAKEIALAERELGLKFSEEFFFM